MSSDKRFSCASSIRSAARAQATHFLGSHASTGIATLLAP
jgi:hypothetical protein